MEQQHYVLTWNKENCRIGGRRGTLDIFCVEEILPNGQRRTVHADIQFGTRRFSSDLIRILHRLVRNRDVKEGRAA